MDSKPMYCKQLKDNMDQIQYSQKGNRVYLSFNDEKIYIQTPNFRIPFNLQNKTTKDGRIFMKSLSFSTGSLKPEEDEKIKANNSHIKKFVKFLKELDKRIVNDFQGKEYRHSLYQSNPDYAPTFSVNIRTGYNNSDELKMHVFDANNQQIKIEEGMFKNKVGSAILHLESIWISGEKMGVNWFVEQLKLLDAA